MSKDIRLYIYGFLQSRTHPKGLFRVRQITAYRPIWRVICFLDYCLLSKEDACSKLFTQHHMATILGAVLVAISVEDGLGSKMPHRGRETIRSSPKS